MSEERSLLIRQVRQRLEALRRAGLGGFPLVVEPRSEMRPEPPEPVPALEVKVEETLAVVAPVTRLQQPQPAERELVAPMSLFGADAIEGPVLPAAERPAQLALLAAEVARCTRCPQLASTRTQTVFGEGSPTARVMFIGEAPGAEEDRTGRPFVGRAGQLLNDMITKGMGLNREDVYIANILKSRPPENRQPMPDEMAHCMPYLERQIEIIRPEFLCLLGLVAATGILGTTLSLSRQRGRWLSYRGIPTIVTYHPAYLLRNPASKKEAWEDLQMLMKAMGLNVPERKQRST
ncbi:MAG TPA: uracil-DNA glycosylase [Isosphaeraceae bacterium]|jgi:DNA polymerase|nr:uracil-DNA glycosylase [Isosphaeraceae bacterium]